MKWIQNTFAASLALCASISAQAAITWPAELPANVLGTDGALTVNTGSYFDLGQAPTGAWNGAGNGSGIFDPDKWAVVFKFSSVKIARDYRLSFTNHPSGAPVVWLVSGDVDISGTLDVSGSGSNPGPGGFRGGQAGTATVSASDGFGIGGGTASHAEGCYVSTTGNSCGTSGYGNNLLVPLVGGSGGSGFPPANFSSGGFGGGGGGALLIVATGKVTINGLVDARGAADGWPGSGGGVRIVAEALAGNGTISTAGRVPTGSTADQQHHGRVRLEFPQGGGARWTGTVEPQTIADVPSNPVLLWPSPQDPTVNIVSVNQVAVPAAAVLQANLSQPDLPLLPAGTSQLLVRLKTTNVSVAEAAQRGKVRVRYTPARGNDSLFVDATLDGGSLASADWTATIPMKHDIVVLQAIAENPKPQ